jgi:peptidoglycan/xylan/chitin deacetylase (PgdA/CDA1 family)
MRRQGVIGTRHSCLPARLLLGLAALALSGAACGPDVPALVTALPSLTFTPVPPASTHTVTPPASSTQVPSVTESPTAIATLTTTPAAKATATSPPAASATAPSATASLAFQGTPPTPDAQASTRQVLLPILLYHYVEPWPADASPLRKALTVQPADFAEQMAYLHQQGYVTVSLYDLMAALALGQPLPKRAVVLTFDDGYRGLIEYAAPALKPYGYTGTIFVITQLMDENLAQYLTWPQAESLYAAGWKIEPHTKTHPALAGRDRDYQLYEMLGSLQTVQAHIGTAPRFFAYPFGKWDAETIKLAKEMHLWAAVTELPGAVHNYVDRYTLHRVRINGTITLPDFIRTIKAAQ